MIDFLKILVSNPKTKARLRGDERLIFREKTERLSHFDFEVIQAKETKVYKGILFCFFENKLEILFRPHYYFNNNKHNANDFTAEDCMAVIESLINEFDLEDELEQFRVINIEFGVNAVSPIDVKDLITFTAYHRRNQFVNDSGLQFSKKSYSIDRQGRANKYKIIKFYAKSLQFPKYAEENLFRFEVKSKKSRFINSLGIYNLGDLITRETYQELKTAILSEIEEVLILHPVNDNSLTKRIQNQLRRYLNPNQWYKDLQKSRNQFSRKKKRYFDILNDLNENIHSDMNHIIKEKLNELLNEKGAYSPPKTKNEKGAYSPINIRGNCTLLENVNYNNRSKPKKSNYREPILAINSNNN